MQKKLIFLISLFFSSQLFCLEQALQYENKNKKEVRECSITDLRNVLDSSIQQHSLQNIVFDYLDIGYIYYKSLKFTSSLIGYYDTGRPQNYKIAFSYDNKYIAILVTNQYSYVSELIISDLETNNLIRRHSFKQSEPGLKKEYRIGFNEDNILIVEQKTISYSTYYSFYFYNLNTGDHAPRGYLENNNIFFNKEPDFYSPDKKYLAKIIDSCFCCCCGAGCANNLEVRIYKLVENYSEKVNQDQNNCVIL